MRLEEYVHDTTARAAVPALTSFPPIDAVLTRTRPRPNACAVIVFRPKESAEALAGVVTGAVATLPSRASLTVSPFSAGTAQGVLVTYDAPRIEPTWARTMQAAIEESIHSSTPILGISVPSGNQTHREALREASDALRLGRHLRLPKSCVCRDDVVAFELLDGDPDLARTLASALAPLKARHRQPAELIRTLEVYLDAGLSVSKAASRLNVHRHTVDNRIARIERALGRSLERQGDRLVIELALHALQLESGRQEADNL